MLMPSIFGEDLFDDFDRMFMPSGFYRPDYGFNQGNGKKNKGLMKTDVKETNAGYQIDMDIPGYKKDEVSAKLENGYLTITASKNTENDKKDEEGHYIRKERFSGTCTRSFYIGENIKQEDIKASFHDGILTLNVPKEDPKKVEESKKILIEG